MRRAEAHPRPPRLSRRSRRGLTLVEAAVIVCVVGVLLAVFIPTFARELRTSKTAEASTQLAHLSQLTAAYYDGSHTGEGGRRLRNCLPPEAGPTPEEPTAEPQEVDFAARGVAGRATWQALGFSPGAVRYRYSFFPDETGCRIRADRGQPLVTLRAEGDLDDDGALSTFERTLAAGGDGLTPAGILFVVDRVE